MPFEEDVAQSLRDTGEQFSPGNITELVSAGFADGRKRRRRRNAAVAGGSAALALIAVGGALTPSLVGGGATPQHAQVASGGMSLTASAKPVPKGANAQQLLAALESVLPKGGSISDTHSQWGAPEKPFSNAVDTARLVYTDSKGAASIAVSLTKYRPGTNQPWTCPPVDPVNFPNDVCHEYKLPGGGQMVVDLGYEYPKQGSGTKSWVAQFQLPDGSELELTEYNAVTEKDSPVTRATPPLTGDQLKAAALSDVWKGLLAQIPTPKPIPAGLTAGHGSGAKGGGTKGGSGASHG